MRLPGVEPGSTAWKAAMLTVIPQTLACCLLDNLKTLILEGEGAIAPAFLAFQQHVAAFYLFIPVAVSTRGLVIPETTITIRG